MCFLNHLLPETFVSTVITNWKTSRPTLPTLITLKGIEIKLSVNGDDCNCMEMWVFDLTILICLHLKNVKLIFLFSLKDENLCNKDVRLSEYPSDVRKNRIPPRPLTFWELFSLFHEMNLQDHHDKVVNDRDRGNNEMISMAGPKRHPAPRITFRSSLRMWRILPHLTNSHTLQLDFMFTILWPRTW